MEILIQNTISKFSKTKNLTQKRPPKVKKNQNIYKAAINQKVYKTEPPKSGNSNSKYNFESFKNQKSNSKKTLKVKKSKKHK